MRRSNCGGMSGCPCRWQYLRDKDLVADLIKGASTAAEEVARALAAPGLGRCFDNVGPPGRPESRQGACEGHARIARV